MRHPLSERASWQSVPESAVNSGIVSSSGAKSGEIGKHGANDARERTSCNRDGSPDGCFSVEERDLFVRFNDPGNPAVDRL